MLPWKGALRTLLIVEGNLTYSKLGQLLNAPEPISLTPSEMIKDFKLALL